MRITTTSRYGVRALFDVSYHGGGEPTQIKDISRRQKISQRYLEQIFNKLLKAGLLKSRRGPRGGYMLAKDSSEISVGDIIQAAQGPIVPVRCLGEDECKRGNCDICQGCVTRHVWKHTQKMLIDYYGSIAGSDHSQQIAEDLISRIVYRINFVALDSVEGKMTYRVNEIVNALEKEVPMEQVKKDVGKLIADLLKKELKKKLDEAGKPQ